MKKAKKLLLLLTLVLSISTPANAPMLDMLSTVETVSAAVGINHKDLTIVKGQRKKLTISGTTKIPRWSSNDERVASVTKKGIVTGKRKGKAVITAKIGDKRYTCNVTVNKYRGIKRQRLTLGKDGSTILRIPNAPKKLNWKSSSPRITKVSDHGKIRAIRPGTCKVYAVFNGYRYVYTVIVTAPSLPPASNPVVTPIPQPPVQPSSVWLSATGEKYHKIPNCGRMNPANARQVSLSEAIGQGYGPCSKCF